MNVNIRCLLSLTAGLLMLFGGCASRKNSLRTQENVGFSVAFYNVENLFDILDDPHKTDNDFLPAGKYGWNSQKYDNKIEKLAQVILSLDSHQTLGFIGLAEIENRQTLEDLSAFLLKKGRKFNILHFESPDRRGIDVAALYRPDLLQMLSALPLQVRDSTDPRFLTRDILHARLTDKKGNPWYMYVNHWPSRLGGEEKSEPKRMHASGILKNHVSDSVFAKNLGARVCIMGDFNDYPNNRSILYLLDAGRPDTHLLVNLSWDAHNRGDGSHNYNCRWGMLDQILVSESVVSLTDTFMVYKRPWMLYYDKKCKDKLPARTLSGSNYFNGYSDHLPVVLKMK